MGPISNLKTHIHGATATARLPEHMDHTCNPENIFFCYNTNFANKFTWQSTISLETCQQNTPFLPMPLKMGMATPLTCTVTCHSAKIHASWTKSGSHVLSMPKKKTDISHFGMWDRSEHHPCDTFTKALLQFFVRYQSPSNTHCLWD